jgi:hypothetical protein
MLNQLNLIYSLFLWFILRRCHSLEYLATSVTMTGEHKMAARVHRLLKLIVFNANDMLSLSYELSKQLEDL